MARLAAVPAPPPVLTVLPGGRRQVTIERDRIEEAYVEVQAVALDEERLGNLSLDVARAIQIALYRQQYGRVAQYADHLEQAVALYIGRAKRARLAAREAIDRIPGGIA